MVPAYNDELGVTAAFNLNLLKHVNRRLGSDFRVRDWEHVALFNREASRIERHLQARQAVPLELDIVVVVQVVEADNLIAPLQQRWDIRRCLAGQTFPLHHRLYMC